MNTTYTYIHTDKSLNRNQVFSCRSSSRGTENQTPSMWLEGRETGPINPHVPYLAITASNWPVVTALQQHHSYCNSAGERDGGWAISQNKYKMGRNNPSFSHLLLLSIKAGWLCYRKISRRFILSSQCNGLIHCANDDLNMSPQGEINLVIFYFTSNASYQTSQLTLTTFSNNWWRSRGWRKWPRGKRLFSFPLKKWVFNRKRVTNRAGEEFYSLVQNILSSLPVHRLSEYFSLGRDIRRSSGLSPC